MGATNGKGSRRQRTEPWRWKWEVKREERSGREQRKEAYFLSKIRSFISFAAYETAAKIICKEWHLPISKEKGASLYGTVT